MHSIVEADLKRAAPLRNAKDFLLPTYDVSRIERAGIQQRHVHSHRCIGPQSISGSADRDKKLDEWKAVIALGNSPKTNFWSFC